jgi:hypothetical protein
VPGRQRQLDETRTVDRRSDANARLSGYQGAIHLHLERPAVPAETPRHENKAIMSPAMRSPGRIPISNLSSAISTTPRTRPGMTTFRRFFASC